MKILLGHDGSDLAWTAFEEALERAAVADDDLTVACYPAEGAESDTTALQAEVRERLAESDVDAELREVSGHVGGALVEIVDSEGFDRLVVAGGDRSTLGKIQLGSVAEFVVLNSETPVTLIR